MYFFTYSIVFFDEGKGDYGAMNSAKGIVVGSSWKEVFDRLEFYYGKDTITELHLEMVDYDGFDILPEEDFPETLKSLQHEMHHLD